MDDTFLGMGQAFWSAINAGASLALGLIAYVQISAARDEARTNRTLAACERYDLDPILDQVCRRLAEARETGDLQSDPRRYRLDLYCILNYLESIAIGVKRGLYSESLVRDHMEPMFTVSTKLYIKSGLIRRVEPADPTIADMNTDEDFSNLLAFVEKWTTIPWYRR